jgi:DNA-binding transcriptional LysR family regulator
MLDCCRESRMQPKVKRGVPITEHEDSAPQGHPDWDGIRIFLEVSRRGSFRSAAEHLGYSTNALRRRIDDLERQLGTVLLTRHVDGIRVTPEGSKILAVAERMETAAFDITRTRDQAFPMLAGEVKIAVTEGLGTFWLAPRLVEFQRSYPRLIVDLNCAMRSADVLRMEADASVQLTQPAVPDLKVIKLGRLHSMPYVSRSYIDTYGLPKRLEEILQHRVVLQIAEQTTTQEVFAKLARGIPQEGFVAMRTNVSSAHYWAIAKGAGIGWLPTYASAIGARIVPLDLDLRFSFDIWLTFHPEAKRIPRVKRSIEWIVESFDARHFPWFRDEFIHPKELPEHYKGKPLINWFEGFSGASKL